MAEGKAKFIEDAARVIDGRVAALEDELAHQKGRQSDVATAADRAAIMEAKHLAALIRSLKLRPYRADPYRVAHDHWAHGRAHQHAE